MELSEVREKINAIDNALKELVDDRFVCSMSVARIKERDNDEVFKPDRECQIYARYDRSDVAFIAIMKKLIQRSRRYQYSIFIEDSKMDEDFWQWVGDKSVFEMGGELSMTVCADQTGQKGLVMKELMSLVTDTTLEITDMNIDYPHNTLSICYRVTEDERKEALVLAYMLYKETINQK